MLVKAQAQIGVFMGWAGLAARSLALSKYILHLVERGFAQKKKYMKK